MTDQAAALMFMMVPFLLVGIVFLISHIDMDN